MKAKNEISRKTATDKEKYVTDKEESLTKDQNFSTVSI